MEAILNSFALVFIGEMGDKTQLLALLLIARFQKPWTILLGVFIATILNHALASWVGTWAAGLVSQDMLKWSLALIFFAFGVWILFPDKQEDMKDSSRWGALITTVIAFFLAEMGDKTQLATVALAAKYSSITLVTIGSTLGMMGSNALAIFLGDRLLSKIPMKWIRRFACALFIAFGVAILLG